MVRWMTGLAAAAAALAMWTTAAAEPGERLSAFRSEAEFRAYLAAHGPQDPPPVCPPDQPDCEKDSSVDDVVITASRAAAAPSIANNQEAGVDEGDIVKMRGDTLIILRRGRLFTLDTAGDGLRAVDSINAFPPGLSPDQTDGDWYDEMLVADDWVVVIGYSYERGGTEINRFRLDRRGRIRFVDSHHLSSEDYYSSRNYASRLVGGQLVVYSPIEVYSADQTLAGVPELIRWRGGGQGAGQTLVRPQDIYRAPPAPDGSDGVEALHAVIRCDLTRPRLTCRATAILGPSSRTFYVGPDATYVWMTGGTYGGRDTLTHAFVYRVPLDGSRPTAARVLGAPTDQFSFAEDKAAGLLRVLVRSDGGGDAMWRPEFSEGSVALLTLPLSRFGDGVAAPEAGDYRMLGAIPDNAWRFVNRFTDAHVLYSVSGLAWEFDDDEGQALLDVVPLAGGAPTRYLLAGQVERIEPVGADALVVSRGADRVFFRTVNLAVDARRLWSQGPNITNTYVMQGANGAETRSHAFFYRPDPDSPDGERGVMGLPVVRGVDQDNGLFDAAADMAFLRRRDDRVVPIGQLASNASGQADDGCQVSCVDWYGDARPIFVGDRIFALLGYELVEGAEIKGQITERRRVSFAPPPAPSRRD